MTHEPTQAAPAMHTPGDWAAQRSGRNDRMMNRPGWNPDDPYQCGLRVYGDSRLICTMADEFGTPEEQRRRRAEQEANARIIAAAPYLLACLREQTRLLDQYLAGELVSMPTAIRQQSKQAIALAEGRTA